MTMTCAAVLIYTTFHQKSFASTFQQFHQNQIIFSLALGSENPKNLADDNSDDNSLGSLPDKETKDVKKKSNPKSVTPAKKKSAKKKDTSLLDLVNNFDASQPNKEPKFDIKDAVILESDTMLYAPVKEYLRQFKDPKYSAE